MSSKPRTYKRRHFFIKKDFQARFIVHFCLLIIAGGILSTALVLYFSRGNLTSLFHNSRLVVTDTASFLLPVVFYTGLITAALISIAVILVALFVSHKIAGPVFRLEKDIGVIGNGDLSYSIHLRKGDQLRELAEDINQMTTKLNAKIVRLESGLKQVVAMASQENAQSEFQEELQRLDDRIRRQFRLCDTEECGPC